MITLFEYNQTSKVDLIYENRELKSKLASVCAELNISGGEAKELTPENLRALAKGIVSKVTDN